MKKANSQRCERARWTAVTWKVEDTTLPKPKIPKVLHVVLEMAALVKTASIMKLKPNVWSQEWYHMQGYTKSYIFDLSCSPHPSHWPATTGRLILLFSRLLVKPHRQTSWATLTPNIQHDISLVLRLGGSDLLEVNRWVSGASKIFPINQDNFVSKGHPQGLLICINRWKQTYTLSARLRTVHLMIEGSLRRVSCILFNTMGEVSKVMVKWLYDLSVSYLPVYLNFLVRHDMQSSSRISCLASGRTRNRSWNVRKWLTLRWNSTVSSSVSFGAKSYWYPNFSSPEQHLQIGEPAWKQCWRCLGGSPVSERKSRVRWMSAWDVQAR